MAGLGARHADIQAAGAGVAALSVDDAGRADHVRRRYALPFPLLCDTDGAVARAWGLFDPGEKGGVARSATYVIEPGLRVSAASLDGVVSRVRAAELIAHLRAGVPGTSPARRVVVPTPGELLRTALPAIRLTLAPPRRSR